MNDSKVVLLVLVALAVGGWVARGYAENFKRRIETIEENIEWMTDAVYWELKKSGSDIRPPPRR